MPINEQIKKIIKARRVRQIDLAHKIGMTPTSFSSFLNGHHRTTQEKIDKLLDILNLELKEKEGI